MTTLEASEAVNISEDQEIPSITFEDTPQATAFPPELKEATSSQSLRQSFSSGAFRGRKDEFQPKKTSSLFANRESEAYKWQRSRGVVGALEIESEPRLRTRAELKTHYTDKRELTFQFALEGWKDFKLRDSLVIACDELPRVDYCCGFVRDDDATKKVLIAGLNEKWVKKANKKLQERGFKVDCFMWNWQNPSGKADTNIILIRFFELSSYRLKCASEDGSINLEFDMDAIEEQIAESDPAKPAKKEEMAR